MAAHPKVMRMERKFHHELCPMRRTCGISTVARMTAVADADATAAPHRASPGKTRASQAIGHFSTVRVKYHAGVNVLLPQKGVLQPAKCYASATRKGH